MPQLDEATLAAQYGFAMAVLQSDPELHDLFRRAVAETWTPERFTASLRATNWFQSHSEQWRNTSILKSTDPATYAKNLEQMRVRVGMMASELGVGGLDVNAFAEQAYTLGWDDNQLRRNISTYIQHTDGRFFGQAGQWIEEWRQHAADMGVTLNDEWYARTAAWIMGGRAAPEDAITQITGMAASAYPHLKDRLLAGETLATISEPYRQSMATLLEINPAEVKVSDPLIKQALATRGQDGQVSTRTLWEFENDLRGDSRWLKTKNALDAGQATVNRILSDFGIR